MPKQGKASLLLVDDDPDLLRLLAIRLKANGYDVTAVDSGQRALASIAASRPDLVLTDLKMENMDGMALFQEIHDLFRKSWRRSDPKGFWIGPHAGAAWKRGELKLREAGHKGSLVGVWR